MGQRIARLMSAAAGLAEVAHCEEPAALGRSFSLDPRLLGCDAADLPVALEWAERHPRMALVLWTSGDTAPALEAARRNRRISSVIGWPSFASAPRALEIALSVRRTLAPELPPPRLGEMLGLGATVLEWRPRTSADRDEAVSEVARWAERAGAPQRLAEKLAELSHELLMNAMYDAPADAEGRPRYAHDRKRDISLDEAEVPAFRLGTDGERLALSVVDPFGRLRRHHVFDGILRGLGARGAASAAAELDTTGGGAGLGMMKIYGGSAALYVDVARGASTQVTSLHDLNVNPRELRSLPVSLHYYERRSRGGEDA